jgi:hypothetical protein
MRHQQRYHCEEKDLGERIDSPDVLHLKFDYYVV